MVKGLLGARKSGSRTISKPSWRATSNLHHWSSWLPSVAPGALHATGESLIFRRRSQGGEESGASRDTKMPSRLPTILHVSLVLNHQQHTSPHLLSSCWENWPPLHEALHHLRSVIRTNWPTVFTLISALLNSIFTNLCYLLVCNTHLLLHPHIFIPPLGIFCHFQPGAISRTLLHTINIYQLESCS